MGEAGRGYKSYAHKAMLIFARAGSSGQHMYRRLDQVSFHVRLDLDVVFVALGVAVDNLVHHPHEGFLT